MGGNDLYQSCDLYNRDIMGSVILVSNMEFFKCQQHIFTCFLREGTVQIKNGFPLALSVQLRYYWSWAGGYTLKIGRKSTKFGEGSLSQHFEI